MILDLLALVLLFLLLVVAVICGIALYLTLPLSDLLNKLARRIGLAGPAPGSRSIGGHGVGQVLGGFRTHAGQTQALGKVLVQGEIWNAHCDADLAHGLRNGDAVEIVYDDQLTVTVLRKADRPG